MIAAKQNTAERILLMTTLTQNTLHFNRSIKLSTETGNVIFREFDEKLEFSQTIAEQLQLADERTICLHENDELLQQ